MQLYIETGEEGVYGLVDTFINETVVLNTKTTYTQDITAVFKGFTNNFSVKSSANNIKLLGYFGFTNRLQPTNVKKRAKLFIEQSLFKEGIITIESASFINEQPSLFELSFSDGKKNLSETLGEDTFASLVGGEITWNSRTIVNGLQSMQSASDGTRWFIPFVSTERIFSLYKTSANLPTDNINYDISKPLNSENVLLPQELRPAIFASDILEAINKKYDVKISPIPYSNNITQLTDLSIMCVNANVALSETKTTVLKNFWDKDTFITERFEIEPKPLINAFELSYLGGSGASTFDFIIQLKKADNSKAKKEFIDLIEVWELLPNGNKKRKIQYTIKKGKETKSDRLRVQFKLDIFKPEGSNIPSALIKPLIGVYVIASELSEWKKTDYTFIWEADYLSKQSFNNTQPSLKSNTVNLFKSLPEMKLIDFVKSIYTMFSYKNFKEGVLNDFYYKEKTIDNIKQKGERVENDLTPFADLSKVTKKTNTKYDAYNLKHATSDYQQNKAFVLANGQEWGQLKYPENIKPKAEFKIETKFTAPVFSPLATDADDTVLTFYPFGIEPKLNETNTRFIYETIIKEIPIFYYQGNNQISTPYAFVDTALKKLVALNFYHKIGHKSTRVFTETNNYISSLFNIVSGDYIDQNTLYVQSYKNYIENTLSGKHLIHTFDLELPSVEMQKFDDNQEIIIKENKFTILESSIGLTDGKTKLTLLNQ